MPSKSLSQTHRLPAKATPTKLSNKIAKIPRQDKKKKAKSQLVPHSRSNQLSIFKENSLFDNFFKDSIFSNDIVSNIFEPFHDFPFKSMDNFFDDMNEEFEEDDFEDEIEEMMENPPALEDPEHTSCYVKVMKNDNGHVQMKAMKKVPSEEWESVQHEYYEKKRPALKAIKNSKKDLVTIEDETEH